MRCSIHPTELLRLVLEPAAFIRWARYALPNLRTVTHPKERIITSFLTRFLIALTFSVVSILLPLAAIAETSNIKIGIVLMHGKGGAPTKYVSGLASSLEAQGFLVANLEMPWSGRRDYDVNVGAAEKEIDSALGSLRDKGAQKLFVAGHSQGGLFALYFGTKHVVDGVIAIAPGGNVGNPTFREKLGEFVELARKLFAEGKADEKAKLADYEGAKGTYPITTTPSVYLTWFDPEGAMNQTTAIRSMNPAIPVLFIAPANDYPGLLKIKQQMFDALPKNPHSKLYEPNSNHVNAPSASIKEIVEWITAVARTQ
ncbi:MAG: alpha/beta hydrolase [Gallionella sp.]|nr:alpha/beta hydrolase [Gallionella sp.]